MGEIHRWSMCSGKGDRIIVGCSDCAEMAEARIRELEGALRFYADGSHYDDWHDTGRTEPEEFNGEVHQTPVWESTLSEDRGAKARAALSEAAHLDREKL